jgi:hypothetical protein
VSELSNNKVVFCPFYRESRARYMSVTKECDHLNNGLPVCLSAGFYFDEEPDAEEWLNGGPINEPERCPHCVISDAYNPKAKNGCYFTNEKCLTPKANGFDACLSCRIWQSDKH